MQARCRRAIRRPGPGRLEQAARRGGQQGAPGMAVGVSQAGQQVGLSWQEGFLSQAQHTRVDGTVRRWHGQPTQLAQGVGLQRRLHGRLQGGGQAGQVQIAGLFQLARRIGVGQGCAQGVSPG